MARAALQQLQRRHSGHVRRDKTNIWGESRHVQTLLLRIKLGECRALWGSPDKVMVLHGNAVL